MTQSPHFTGRGSEGRKERWLAKDWQLAELEVELRSSNSWVSCSFHCRSLSECRSLTTQTFAGASGIFNSLPFWLDSWILSPGTERHSVGPELQCVFSPCLPVLPYLPATLPGSPPWLLFLPHLTIPAPPLGHWFFNAYKPVYSSLTYCPGQIPSLITQSLEWQKFAQKHGTVCLYSLILDNISLESRILGLPGNLLP